ncbi:MOSC N-terminal beta barrel domain-containing protein [Halomonas sp. BN3-1]|uniref:MOSC domain-containing protein n=1 Tax=Halomonas sp. BN3-1 TaxID=2082393 RepID=UPI000D3C0F82|nr:MOSC N-terminal beta barrel domain-containing protein [Halomonas sp. BN3-1]
MKLSTLACYPVKSLRGIALSRAELTERGLAFDRRWMLVDDDGRFVTQREIPALATIGVELSSDTLRLVHDRMAPLVLSLDEPKAAVRRVRVWQSECQALDEGDGAANWLAEALAKSLPEPQREAGRLRLVRLPREQRRWVETEFLPPAERGVVHTAFADGYPLLIASEASLAALNQRLEAKGEAPVPMERFRPNLVVSGGDPFAERDWASLAGPGYRLGLRKPCKRCKIITLDQRSGEAPSAKEPLKTLVEMDTQPGWKGAFFGQNAVVEQGVGAILRVGDVLDSLS